MVLYDSLPRPRRSISAAAALEDKCDNSRRTGSSSASRAAAASRLASAISCRPSLTPRALAAASAALVRLADHRALLLRHRRVDVQRERVDVAAQRGDDERHPLRHQTCNERDVTAEPVELGDGNFAPGLLGRLQRRLQLRPPVERIAPLPVSTSVNSATISKPSASAKLATALRWASRPRPERPCFWVETR